MVPRRLTAASLTLLALAGCTRAKTVSKAQSSADLFSDRPITATPELYVVTLTAPPLLQAGTKTASGWEIPESAKQTLLAEQDAFIQAVQQIAPQARIVYRYRLTLNGVALYAADDIKARIASLPGVSRVENGVQFRRPEPLQAAKNANAKPGEVTSVNFIGADRAHELGFRGHGLRIGILDTGIDYTHSMLGGSGAEADFKAIDPSQPTPTFPNRKVVGGIDLVGSGFNPASPLPAKHLPEPDANPIDEAGHGTHVAGTVAGIGDGVNTYSGVAPEAELYAVKVFGKVGSTADAVVIAGFEFAADPNGDLNPDDQLDVINLSLGGGFGQPHTLYNEAVRNLTRAGTLVVAAAGNSGAIDHIVGAPSTAEEALSVAASVDGSDHNWRFAAVRFALSNGTPVLAKAIEGPLSKPIADIGPTSGELVDIGLADAELSDELKQSLSGKVAFIQRGKVPFSDKLKRAVDAGAIGAVVYNNDPGTPIPMGGDGHFDIPAIMISQALGFSFLGEMRRGPVKVDFKAADRLEEPELIDTITEFSSRGPRSEDNLLKPEIAAPGSRVISAAMGKGGGGIELDGTSMASPHMAGVMALLKEAHRDLSPEQLKALAMTTSKPLGTSARPVPITAQGAGRVQVNEAVTTPLLVSPAALSLGRIQLTGPRRLKRTLKLRNLQDRPLALTTRPDAAPGLTLSLPASVALPANGETEVEVEIGISLQNAGALVGELNGRIEFLEGTHTVAQVAALAIRTQASSIRAQGTPEALRLTNASAVPGPAMVFNLLGEDARKTDPTGAQRWKGTSCDLQSAGYRILRKPTNTGDSDVIQFAFKLHAPVSTWHLCEVSVLIDSNGDGVAEQELAGINASGLSGLGSSSFATVLLDAAAARSIRANFEKEVAAGNPAPPNYQPALLGAGPMAPFPQSTIAVIEAPLKGLATGEDGQLHVKLATIGDQELVEADDHLGEGPGDWFVVPANADAQPWKIGQELIPVGPGGAAAAVTRGSGSGKLVLYYPINDFAAEGQSQTF